MHPKLWGIVFVIVGLLSADLVVVAQRAGEPAEAPLVDRTPSASDDPPTVDPTKRGKKKGQRKNAPATQERADEVTEEPAALTLPFEPPAPGLYRYATESHAEFGPQQQDQEGVDRYSFKAPRRVDDALEQVVVVRQDNDGGTMRRTNRWATDGLYRTKDQHGSSTCTYDPPALVVPFPIRIGETWPSEPTCSGQGQQEGYEAETSSEVLREEEVEVAGQTVFTYVIEETSDVTFETEQGSGRSHAVTLKWFSPAHRLFVKTRTDITAEFDEPPFPGIDGFEASSSTEILNLSPR